MGITLNVSHQSGQTPAIRAEADFSIYPLRQLLRARHWFDADRDHRGRWIEDEIQKRCARLQDTIRGKESGANARGHRFKPYGLMFGVVFLVLSSGPFVAVKCLDAMNIVIDAGGDNAFLTGLWAVLTLPFAVMIYMIGGMIDAERVVKWFHL
ncbi:MAG: hypothetical protein WD688_20360 [Candidatus Binatia bacterium]